MQSFLQVFPCILSGMPPFYIVGTFFSGQEYEFVLKSKQMPPFCQNHKSYSPKLAKWPKNAFFFFSNSFNNLTSTYHFPVKFPTEIEEKALFEIFTIHLLGPRTQLFPVYFPYLFIVSKSQFKKIAPFQFS